MTRSDISLAVKKEVWERAFGLCEICVTQGDFRGLHIHHRKPKGMGGTKKKFKADELILLCGKCHSAKHGIREV